MQNVELQWNRNRAMSISVELALRYPQDCNGVESATHNRISATEREVESAKSNRNHAMKEF
jgi:hypothetical protein